MKKSCTENEKLKKEKGAMNSYIFYLQIRRVELCNDSKYNIDGAMPNNIEITKIISKEWKSLDENTKK